MEGHYVFDHKGKKGLTQALGSDILKQMQKKDKAAVSLGRRGGKARMAALSPEERTKLSKKGAKARWKRREILERLWNWSAATGSG